VTADASWDSVHANFIELFTALIADHFLAPGNESAASGNMKILVFEKVWIMAYSSA
jgi:hypothetical protein